MHLKTFAVSGLLVLAGATAAQAEPEHVCYVNDGYFVSATSDAEETNTVFSILRKTSPDQTMACPLPADKADFVVGEGDFGTYFYDLFDNHLLLEVSTGPVGDLLVVDLRDGKTILNVSGVYDYLGDEGLYFSERGEEGTPETCDQYAEYTAMGLGTGLLHQKLLNLDTGAITETGETSCEAVS